MVAAAVARVAVAAALLAAASLSASSAPQLAAAQCTPTQYGPFTVQPRAGDTTDTGVQIWFGVDATTPTTICHRVVYTNPGLDNSGMLCLGTGDNMVNNDIVALVTGDVVETYRPTGRQQTSPTTSFSITNQMGSTAGTTRTLEFTRATGYVAGWNPIIYGYSTRGSVGAGNALGDAGQPHDTMGAACINTVTGAYSPTQPCPAATTGAPATTGTTGMGGGSVNWPVGPGGLPNTEVQAGEYDNQKQLGTLTVHWSIVSGNILSIALFQEPATGWIALGYQASMVDSDVTLGYIDASNVVHIGDAQVAGTGNPPTLDTTQNILQSGGIQNGTRLTLRWTRQLNTGDASDFTLTQPADLTTPFPVIVAYHLSQDDPTIVHSQRYNNIDVPWFAPPSSCTSICTPLGTCNTAASPPVCQCSAANSELKITGVCGCVAGYVNRAGQCVRSGLTLTRAAFLPGQAVSGPIKFSWEIVGENIVIGLRASAGTAGWIAMGFGSSMNDADVYQAGTDNPAVIDGLSINQLQPPEDVVNNVDDFTTGVLDGEYTIMFQRALVTTDAAQDKPVPNTPGESSDVILALAPPGSNFGNKHTYFDAIKICWYDYTAAEDCEIESAATPAAVTTAATTAPLLAALLALAAPALLALA